LTGPLSIADGAWNNSVSYTTPSLLGGLRVNVTQSFGESDNVGDRTGISLFYTRGPLNLTATAVRAGRNNLPSITPATAVTRQNTLLFTGAYDFGVARVSAGFLQTHHDYTTIADDTFRTYYVGATAPLGRGTLLWQTAISRGTEAINVRRQTTSVGYDYFLSKQMSVYAMFMYDQFTNMASGTSYALGLQKRF
jgi:predicted porin